MHRVSIGMQDGASDTKAYRVDSNEHSIIREEERHKQKRKRVLLPRLPRMQGLSVKLGLSGRKLRGDRSVEFIGNNVRTSLEKDGCL